MNRAIFAPAIACALALTSIASVASAGTPAPSVTISAADLNLRTSEGRKTLDARLRAAVKKVCAPKRLPGSKGWVSYRKCVTSTANQVTDERDKLVADAQQEPSLARTAPRTR